MKKIRIIDNRTKEKFMMDDAYYNGYAKKCGWKASIVYFSLCRHANKDQFCFPSINYMAKQNNVSRPTIISGIKTLKKWNIIDIEKTRNRGGTWSNNSYVLMDKSVWINNQVNDIDLDNQVNENTSPSKPPLLDQVNDIDSKETHIKETHSKDSEIEISRVELDDEGNLKRKKSSSLKDSPLVLGIMKSFEMVNPTCKTYYRNIAQKNACKFLIDEYGFEKVNKVIKELLPKIKGMEFMPTITTPVQLKDKWASLESAVKRKQSELKVKKPIVW